jgi:PAS domain S-box-containing protein
MVYTESNDLEDIVAPKPLLALGGLLNNQSSLNIYGHKMFRYLEKKKRYLPIAAVFIIGIAASIISFVIIDRFDYQRIRESFERGADERYAAFKREIESDLQVLESIKTYYAVSREYRRSDFRMLVSPLLLRHPSIQALEWIPRISDSQRAIYEARAKADGFSNFQISDRKSKGVMVRSPRRSEYYPVYFVEPYKGNEIALGYDLASDPARMESLERSLITGEMAASRRITLVQETAGQFGFIVFDPIYGKDLRSDTIEERRKNLKGFALGVFRIGDILDKSYTYLKPGNINTSLHEAPVPDNDHLLYFHPNHSQKQVNDQKSEPGEKFVYRKSLNVAGQEWLMRFETGPHYIAQEKSLWSWVVLIFVVLLTGISSLYMTVNLRQTEKLSIVNEQLRREFCERQKAELALKKSHEELEARIKARTADLARVNELLQEDIRERKQAEDTALRAKEYWEKTFDAVPDLIAILDIEYRIVRANRAMASRLGVTPGECVGLLCYGVIHGMAEPPEFCPHRRLLEDGLEHIVEVHEDRLDGDFIVSVSPLRDQEGKLIGSIHVARDITERKRAQEVLRESETRYRLLADNATDVIWTTGMDLQLTYVSLSVTRLLGFTVEEAMARTMEQAFTPAAFEKAMQIFTEEVATENAGNGDPNRSRILELELVRKDGSTVPVEGNFRFLRDPAGKAIGLLSIIRDITQRKRMELELWKQYELKSVLMSSIPAYVYIKDTNSVYMLGNKQFSELSGIPENEIPGKTDYDFFSETDADSFRRDDAEIIATEKARLNYEMKGKDGKGNTIWFSTSKSPFYGPSGEIAGLVGICIDITGHKRAEEERRSLEERLQRAEKMESLGTLAGGIAHDLNNVLGIVVGYAEMLLMDADKSSSIKSDLQNIMSGGQRAAAIVQDLLTLARRGVSGRKVINLNRIIADSQESPEFEKLSSYHPSVKMKTDLDPGLFNISGSSVHLGKTLFNLVSNACEAMPGGGMLTIKTDNRYLDKPIHGYEDIREGDYVVLSVSDTGEGISAADLKRIFEPFYTKKVMGRSGTGLGLAVVWGTVKDHNGYINVESEEGKGSTFTLYFPATKEGIFSGAAVISISEYMGNGESILTVDDVKEQRELATVMLEKLNYNVASVSSGEEAIAYLKEHKVDLIVLDMIMDPGMDGLDTYKSILQIHPHQKAIIVSGFSETDRVYAAQAIGAGAYVRKPYVIEKLGLAVRTELDRK